MWEVLGSILNTPKPHLELVSLPCLLWTEGRTVLLSPKPLERVTKNLALGSS